MLISKTFLGGASGKEPSGQFGRHKRRRFHPCVGKVPWRRTWQPTSEILPGESHGQRSLGGYSPKGRKELDTTEETQHASIKEDCFAPTAKTSGRRQWLAVVQSLGVPLRAPGPTGPCFPCMLAYFTSGLQHSCCSTSHHVCLPGKKKEEAMSPSSPASPLAGETFPEAHPSPATDLALAITEAQGHLQGQGGLGRRMSSL